MIQTFYTELLKIKRTKIIYVLAFLPVFSIIIGSANFSINQGVLQNNWFSLWGQVGLFYGQFFFPILISICCAFVCRLEHTNQNWNLLLASPISVNNLYLGKFLIVGIFSLFSQILFVLLYWALGIVLVSENFPSETLIWAFKGWYASLSLIAFQLALSLRIKSFAVPIGICLCSIFLGLFIYVINLGVFFPFSLMTHGMAILTQESLGGIENTTFWVMSSLFTLLISLSSISWIKKNDVRSS